MGILCSAICLHFFQNLVKEKRFKRLIDFIALKFLKHQLQSCCCFSATDDNISDSFETLGAFFLPNSYGFRSI